MQELDELKKMSGRGQAKSDFITHLALIRAAIEAGHPKKTIWKHLSNKKQFRASYGQFMSYVDGLIRSKKADVRSEAALAPSSLTATATDPSPLPPPQPNGSFKFDPFKSGKVKTVAPTGNTPDVEGTNGR